MAVALGLGLAASVLASTLAAANPGGTGLVISEVHGGGEGSGGATDGVEPSQTVRIEVVKGWPRG